MQSTSSEVGLFQVKSKAVHAGAGAGKTYNLTLDVTAFAKNFFNAHKRWPRVVVTTFTKKATQELSERILQRAMDTETDTMPFVNSGYYLQVSTIHGILDRMLKECGSHMGLRRDFTYMSSSEAVFLSKKVLKSILDKEGQYIDLVRHYSFRDLHNLLQEAGEHPLAGYSPVSEQDLMALLTEQVSALKAELIDVIGQIQGMELTPKWGEVLSLMESLTLLVNTKNWEANRKRIGELLENLSLNGLKPRKEGPLLDIYPRFKDCVDGLREFSEEYYSSSCMKLADKYNKQFGQLLNDYTTKLHLEKKTINKIEISDLEVFAQQMMMTNKADVEKYARQFDYWVIDEFQDTSPLQLELLTTLIGSSPYHIVGDPQQSIYLFRGARSEVFSGAVEVIKKNNGDYVQLIKNYRSQEKALETINFLTNKLGPAFSPMEPTKPTENDEPSLYIQAGCSEEYELAHVYRHVLNLLEKGARFEDIAILVRKNEQLKTVGEYLSSQKIPVHLSSSGQFWRRREVMDCILLLKFILNPYDEAALTALLRMPFLPTTDEDIVGWIQDDEPLWAYLSQAQANATSAVAANTYQILNDILQVAQLQGVVHGFLNALDKFKFFDHHLIYDSSGRAEGNVWMFIHKLRTFESTTSGTFFDFIADCEKAEFLVATSDAPGAIDNNKIAIMTIHAAKGLQFEHVLMPFMATEQYIENKKQFLVDEIRKKWCIRTPSSEKELSTSSSLYEKNILAYFKTLLQDEDARLFYVAITRAIQSIYVSWNSDVKNRSWSHYFCDFKKEVGTHKLIKSHYHVYANDVGEQKPTLSATNTQTVVAPYKILEKQSQTTAVTDFVSGASFKQTDKNFYKIRLGILFHKLLETLAKPVNIDVRATVEAWFGDDAETVADALNYILQLEEPPVAQLLKAGKPEWGFLNKDGDSFIQGQIDLWGIIDNTLWVIDYKSGSTVNEIQLIHQLSSYALALKKYLHWQGDIQLGVVYPFSKKTFVRDM